MIILFWFSILRYFGLTFSCKFVSISFYFIFYAACMTISMSSRNSTFNVGCFFPTTYRLLFFFLVCILCFLSYSLRFVCARSWCHNFRTKIKPIDLYAMFGILVFHCYIIYCEWIYSKNPPHAIETQYKTFCFFVCLVFGVCVCVCVPLLILLMLLLLSKLGCITVKSFNCYDSFTPTTIHKIKC